MGTVVTNKKCFQCPSYKENLFKDFQSFSYNETFIDMCFICANGKTVYAHKLVLCSVSHQLKSIVLELPAGIDLITINLPDINDSQLAHVIRFLYTGNLKISPGQLNDYKDIMVLLGIEINIQIPSNEDFTTYALQQRPSTSSFGQHQTGVLPGLQQNQDAHKNVPKQSTDMLQFLQPNIHILPIVHTVTNQQSARMMVNNSNEKENFVCQPSISTNVDINYGNQDIKSNPIVINAREAYKHVKKSSIESVVEQIKNKPQVSLINMSTNLNENTSYNSTLPETAQNVIDVDEPCKYQGVTSADNYDCIVLDDDEPVFLGNVRNVTELQTLNRDLSNSLNNSYVINNVIKTEGNTLIHNREEICGESSLRIQEVCSLQKESMGRAYYKGKEKTLLNQRNFISNGNAGYIVCNPESNSSLVTNELQSVTNKRKKKEASQPIQKKPCFSSRGRKITQANYGNGQTINMKTSENRKKKTVPRANRTQISSQLLPGPAKKSIKGGGRKKKNNTSKSANKKARGLIKTSAIIETKSCENNTVADKSMIPSSNNTSISSRGRKRKQMQRFEVKDEDGDLQTALLSSLLEVTSNTVPEDLGSFSQCTNEPVVMPGTSTACL